LSLTPRLLTSKDSPLHILRAERGHLKVAARQLRKARALYVEHRNLDIHGFAPQREARRHKVAVNRELAVQGVAGQIGVNQETVLLVYQKPPRAALFQRLDLILADFPPVGEGVND